MTDLDLVTGRVRTRTGNIQLIFDVASKVVFVNAHTHTPVSLITMLLTIIIDLSQSIQVVRFHFWGISDHAPIVMLVL